MSNNLNTGAFTKTGQCERGGCSTTGELHLLEWDGFKADTRGVINGRRWYCAECKQTLQEMIAPQGEEWREIVTCAAVL
jgi:hypothetical protein